MNENTKKERLRLLKKIIKENEISDQIQLLDELKRKGIDTTQATISRDLQELKIIKIRVRPGMYKYEVLEKPQEGDLWNQLGILFENFVYELKSTGNLLIIKTSPGNANSVAVVCDRLGLPQIMGTIAGDDTILMIIDREENRIALEKRFNAILEKIS